MKLFRLIGLNFLFALIAVELSAVTFFAIRHSAFYYSMHRNQGIPGAVSLVASPSPSNPPDRSDAELGNDAMRFHPYLGYVFAREGPPRVPKEEDKIVIGLFGNSTMPPLVPRLRDELNERIQAAGLAPGRKVETVFMGTYGYRQPQFLQMLTYYLSRGTHFDAVVLMDGVSEVYHSVGNERHGVGQYMPYWGYMLTLREMGHMGGLASVQTRLLVRVERAREGIAYWQSVYRRSPSAFVGVLADVMARRRNAEYDAASKDFVGLKSENREDFNLYLDPPSHLSESEIFARGAENWARSTMMMHTLLAADHVPYLHILEPVRFDKSWLIARPAKPPVDRLVDADIAAGYSFLLKQVPAIEGDGVDFLDASAILDHVGKSVFVDCCHFNKTGEGILVKIIADALMKQFASSLHSAKAH
jgi:hypothetical protein